jgi:hypothetical protein
MQKRKSFESEDVGAIARAEQGTNHPDRQSKSALSKPTGGKFDAHTEKFAKGQKRQHPAVTKSRQLTVRSEMGGANPSAGTGAN